MRRHYGGPVSGDMFWPRPDIIEPLISTLRRGESCALFGLKRIGKSSILMEVESRLKDDPTLVVVRVDVQRFAGLDELFAALVKALPSSALQKQILGRVIQNPLVAKVLRNFLERFASNDATHASAEEGRAIIDYWSLLAGEIENAIKTSGQRVVLMIDELPFLIENMMSRGAQHAQIDSLLAALRGWRHRAGVVNVFAGSIGMQWLVREHGIQSAHLNDFVRISVPPLDRDEARRMIDALAVGEHVALWQPETTNAVLENLAAFYPSFIQYAFGRVCDHGAITKRDVDALFDDIIRPGVDVSFFEQFRHRLARYAKGDRRAAETIISTVVKSYPTPVNFNAIWDALATHADCADPDSLIDSLREDGFLDLHGDRIGVTSPLVVGWSRSRARRERPAA